MEAEQHEDQCGDHHQGDDRCKRGAGPVEYPCGPTASRTVIGGRWASCQRVDPGTGSFGTGAPGCPIELVDPGCTCPVAEVEHQTDDLAVAGAATARDSCRRVDRGAIVERDRHGQPSGRRVHVGSVALPDEREP